MTNETTAGADRRVTIAAPACVRCGSCTSIAPRTFVMGGKVAEVLRQPVGEKELRDCGAAMLNCPAGAVRWEKGSNAAAAQPAAGAAIPDGESGSEGFGRLLVEADRIRWRMSDIAWDEFKGERVNDTWKALVREIVTSELPTFSGAGRFMRQFTDDFDFTQWVTMWQFEETRHPHVLIAWLARCGEAYEATQALAARETFPLVDSKIATLTLNIISEMMASAGYMALHRSAPEPVLRSIALNLAADEARHASGFFMYARRILELSVSPERERANVLRILYLWMNRSEGVRHPLALLHQRVLAEERLSRYVERMEFQSNSLHSRICQMIGKLVGVPIRSKDDILGALARISVRDGSTAVASQLAT